MNTIKTGRITGTGAAINVPLGFVPDYVKVFNPNDAGALFASIERWRGMAAASGLKTLKTADNGTTSNLSSNYITSNGLSDFAGSATVAKGFTVGADTDLNAVGEVFYFIAMRGTDGQFGKADVNGAYVA